MNGNNFALVMEGESGEYFAAISKAQGCDEIKVWDPNFIGWVRRYDGPFFGERWPDSLPLHLIVGDLPLSHE